MEIRPRVLFDRALPAIPKVSLILLDWSCRESFHIFDYLQKQDVPREWFEVLWIEYFDLEAPDIARRIEDATSRGAVPPLDRWIVLNMPRTAYYHKHVMYNAGVVASRGDLVMIGDSDAMVRPQFVRTLVDAFERDSGIVLHLDEVRSQNRKFYPFNYPTFESVAVEASNWRDGKTIGVLDEFDPLHSRNYGACICARREDVVAIGGADEHLDYMGHVCGPYDLTWRLVNYGRREVWHDKRVPLSRLASGHRRARQLHGPARRTAALNAGAAGETQWPRDAVRGKSDHSRLATGPRPNCPPPCRGTRHSHRRSPVHRMGHR